MEQEEKPLEKVDPEVKVPEEQPQNIVKDEPSVKPENVAIVRKKRKKSKKIKRSSNYPKFYQNAYVRYCNDIRPKICEEFPQMDAVDVTKFVASKSSAQYF
jgi:ribosomal protein L24